MTTRSHCIGLLALSALASALPAMPVSAQSIGYADDPAVAVVRYSLVHGEIGEPVRGPSMEIYADGRTRVHSPTYMKGAGDYELRLSREEINDLLNDFASAGLLDVDPRAVRAETRRAAQEEQVGITRPDGIQEIGSVRYSSDPSVTMIEINAVRGQGAAAKPIRKVIEWTNLQHDARRFKHIPAVQRMAEAENRLTGLMQRAK